MKSLVFDSSNLIQLQASKGVVVSRVSRHMGLPLREKLGSSRCCESCLPRSEVTDSDVLAREEVKNGSVVSGIKALPLWKASMEHGLRTSLEMEEDSLSQVNLGKVVKGTEHTGSKGNLLEEEMKDLMISREQGNRP